MLEIAAADAVVLAVRDGHDEPRVVAHAGCDLAFARALARAGDSKQMGDFRVVVESLGRDGHAARVAAIALSRPPGYLVERRLRMVGAVARQGFELCEVRERPARAASAGAIERPLEPLIPGFLCAGAAMARVVDDESSVCRRRR